jgi:hypothetical protein
MPKTDRFSDHEYAAGRVLHTPRCLLFRSCFTTNVGVFDLRRRFSPILGLTLELVPSFIITKMEIA